MVLDSGEVGGGCSTRNGGQISTSIKPSLSVLARRHGMESARAIRSEGHAALQWIEDFVTREQIDCDFNRCGRFHAAHAPNQFGKLVQQAKDLQSEGIEAEIVTRDEQRKELGTDAYFGGVVFPGHASVNPARLHRGFLQAALGAGVHVTPHCAVTDISRNRDGFDIATVGCAERAMWATSTPKPAISAIVQSSSLPTAPT